MMLHRHTILRELVEYCQLCHEQDKKCDRVKVDDLTIRRIRQVAKIDGPVTKFLGIKFVAR